MSEGSRKFECLISQRSVRMASVSAGKPKIGLVGGMGSGKSRVAAAFARAGDTSSPQTYLVTRRWRSPTSRRSIVQRWGDRRG